MAVGKIRIQPDMTAGRQISSHFSQTLFRQNDDDHLFDAKIRFFRDFSPGGILLSKCLIGLKYFIKF